jgi:predicted transcriptional regulator
MAAVRLTTRIHSLHKCSMKSYLQYLQDRAGEINVPLLKCFKRADIPTSTYYRTINGDTELRYDTAVKVINVIEELDAIQQASEHTKRLREANKPVDRSSIRARFKPRVIGS